MYPQSFLQHVRMLAEIALALSLTVGGFAQTSSPAEPTDETEVRDHSEPPLRTLRANIQVMDPGWNERLQRAAGAAVAIRFSGPAAPLDQVGKAIPAGALRITPEVAGEWKWETDDRLVFLPTAGWLPPGDYRLKAGPRLLATIVKSRQTVASTA